MSAATITLQRRVPAAGIPSPASLRIFAHAALGRRGGELTLRITDEAESRALNHRYRGRDYATNVLSFPYQEPGMLGDLVLCAPVVAREAKAQGKPLRAHWAHLVIHGCLHLLGYDHEQSQAAEKMEKLEIRILRNLGFANPYL
ncbi:MAG: rRNA maturation RNase YbeY [Gammaproteobacteria bacterium]